MTKEERILKELERISPKFKNCHAGIRKTIDPLLQNYAFMKVTLEDLQEEINREGVSETYQNGRNQSGMKESSRLKTYNTLLKNFESVTKTLIKSLPDIWEDPEEESLNPIESLFEKKIGKEKSIEN